MSEQKSMSWEEQRDEIQRLNTLCIKAADDIITAKEQTVKYYSKDGEPVYTSIADGLDMLARCSSIAKQWMAESRHSGSDATEVPTEKLMDAMR